MHWYALAVFLSAFLLFQVQPLIGKSILPWFGGAPAVWTTCMLFFQLVLLVGYFYAHLSSRYLSPLRQGYLHASLLAVSVLLLPIIPDVAWKPTDGNDPTFLILALLLTTVGGPYLLLSSTAPLLQSWYFHQYQVPPFRLYALSNAASLLALFTYPIVVERYLGSRTQAWTWSITYLLFAVVCAALAVGLKNQLHVEQANSTEKHQPPAFLDIIFWLSLSATGSVVLLATTNQLCLDVAPVPFLWILPLALYLLSFVICFDAEHWYRRSWFNVLLIIAIFATLIDTSQITPIYLPGTVFILSFTLFICCMTCHGELVRLKPDPNYLSTFYLMIALGGALGGLFVTLIAPRIFVQFNEFPLGLGATCLLAIAAIRYERNRYKASIDIRPWIYSALGVSAAVLFYFYGGFYEPFKRDMPDGDGVIERKRNFYGFLRVARMDSANEEQDKIVMSHGSTVHGYQFRKEERIREPTAYYVRESGVGLALNHHPKRFKGEALSVGVVGLGCGILSAYMENGDYLRYYEINPHVLEMAGEYFTFDKDAIARGADVDVFMGDARIVLERQLQENFSKKYDILVVDAFTSDSIPVHLLTKECFETYWQHLEPDGILAVHISNRFLDLSPIILTMAENTGKTGCKMSLVGVTNWVLVTSNKQFLSDDKIIAAIDPEVPFTRIEWTDGYSSLFPLLK